MDALSRIATDYANDRTRFDTIVGGIDRAVRKSFVTNPVTYSTDAETRHRIETAANWFVKLRYEAGYSTLRAVDCMEDALICDLSQIDYIPSTRDSWVASATDRDRIILL